MFERLLAPAWPPVAALIIALAVFVGVLATTPPGFGALLTLVRPTDTGVRLPGADARRLEAAYATGAASSLALMALIVLAPALATLHAGMSALRHSADNQAKVPGSSGPKSVGSSGRSPTPVRINSER